MMLEICSTLKHIVLSYAQKFSSLGFFFFFLLFVVLVSFHFEEFFEVEKGGVEGSPFFV